MPGNFMIINRFAAAKKLIRAGSERNILAALMLWHKSLMEVLSGPRSGKVYKVPMTGKKYTASAPGEAPAQASGTLRVTYKYMLETSSIIPTGIIGSPQSYAPKLQYGTSKMAPRPHLDVAYNRKKKDILNALGKRVI
jgi:hypothetical protein